MPEFEMLSPTKRVAVYARVSTHHDDQLSSLEAQKDYYTNLINARNDCCLAEVYADEGKSGTSYHCRGGFNQMIRDAKANKFDAIVTKSISRFARNTVDVLRHIRLLKEYNIGIYFEREDIWTLDAKGEFMITLLTSLAQEEARSLSENTKWGMRKRFADGKYSLAYSCFLGYDKGPKKHQMIINEEQAKVVRLIYRMYLQGYAAYKISVFLASWNIKSPMGKDTWQQTTVISILTNEKYKGDALLQKEFVSDFLTKKRKKNNGEIPQYYVEGNHEAIIDRETWDLVQEEMARRKAQKHRYSGVSIFSSKIKCGICGGWYGSKVWHSNDKYRRVIYQCNNKFKNKQKCGTPHLTEDEIKQVAVTAINQILPEENELIANTRMMLRMVCNTAELELEQNRLTNEMQSFVSMSENLVQINKTVAMDQDEYQRQYDELIAKYERARMEYEQISSQVEEKETKKKIFMAFISELQKLENTIEEFDEAMWGRLIEGITVYSKSDIRVSFKNGLQEQISIM